MVSPCSPECSQQIKKPHVAAGHFRSCGVLVIVVGRPTDNTDEKNIGFLSHKSPAVKTGLTSKE